MHLYHFTRLSLQNLIGTNKGFKILPINDASKDCLYCLMQCFPSQILSPWLGLSNTLEDFRLSYQHQPSFAFTDIWDQQREGLIDLQPFVPQLLDTQYFQEWGIGFPGKNWHDCFFELSPCAERNRPMIRVVYNQRWRRQEMILYKVRCCRGITKTMRKDFFLIYISSGFMSYGFLSQMPHHSK